MEELNKTVLPAKVREIDPPSLRLRILANHPVLISKVLANLKIAGP